MFHPFRFMLSGKLQYIEMKIKQYIRLPCVKGGLARAEPLPYKHDLKQLDEYQFVYFYFIITSQRFVVNKSANKCPEHL